MVVKLGRLKADALLDLEKEEQKEDTKNIRQKRGGFSI